jgi:hypothetical protein
MEKTGRVRRGECAWREMVARQEESGLTVQAFCGREGIKSPSLYSWRSRMRDDVQLKKTRPSARRTRMACPSEGTYYGLGCIPCACAEATL